MAVINFILVTACVASLATAEIFTSMAQLQAALHAEHDIADVINMYVKSEQYRLNQLKRTAEEFESHSQHALENPDKYMANPIDAFLFVKKFTLDWDRDIGSLFETNRTQEGLLKTIAFYRESLPSNEDLNGAVSGLMRLQDTYQLDTSRLAEGDINGIRASELSADACFEIGRVNYMHEDYPHTEMWMKQALHSLPANTLRMSERKAEILDYLAFTMFKQGNLHHALSLTRELLLLEPDHERAKNNIEYYERMIADEEKTQGKRGEDGDVPIRNVRQVDDYRKSVEFTSYEALCRGEDIMPIKDVHKLKCRYLTNNHPLLIIQPAKMEEVHLKPFIVMYHDFLSHAEIQNIENIAMPKLHRATVSNAATGVLETASYRVSKSAWLKTDEHKDINRVVSRVEAITGLNMATAEELQVANYGIGGHYEPHFDFAREEEKNTFESLGTGNRVATWINYMSDVEAGGATVFPRIGVKVFPKKGMSAFWYNLYQSGRGIYDTRHAACPVLVGTKWVSTKWIHERGQEFRRPCSLNLNE